MRVPQGSREAGRSRGRTVGPREFKRAHRKNQRWRTHQECPESREGGDRGEIRRREEEGRGAGHAQQVVSHPTRGPTDAASLALTILPPGDGRILRLQYHPGGWDTHATSPPICLPNGLRSGCADSPQGKVLL